MKQPQITSRQERLIQQVIRYFDWEKVEKAMAHLNWVWALPTGMSIPTRFQLQQKAYDLLRSSTTCKICATGGLSARYTYEAEDDYECYELEFVLTAWEVDSESLPSYETGTPKDLLR